MLDLVGGKADISNKELSLAMNATPGMDLDNAVLKVMESLYIPSQDRQNVKKGSKNSNRKLRGMCLGAINTRHGFKTSSITWSRQNITRLLSFWIRQSLPNFNFTSIQASTLLVCTCISQYNRTSIHLNKFQVNYNALCNVHVDKGNLGPSAFIGIGNYTGGKLW